MRRRTVPNGSRGWEHKMAAVWYVSHICVTKPEARGESKRDGNNTEYGGPAGVQAWGKRSFTESQSMGIFNLLVKKREENQKTRSKWYTLKKTQTPQNQGWKVVCSHLNLSAQGRSRWTLWLENGDGDFQPSSRSG